MVLFLFCIAVAIYCAFLVWCLAPLLRWRSRRWTSRLRVVVGVLLLAANVFPPFALPLLIPVHMVSNSAASALMAVLHFPRTLPAYVHNAWVRQSATATIVEVAYPIEVAGVRYAPVVRTACTTRRMIGLDKGVGFVAFKAFPTASGADYEGRDGATILALDQWRLCSLASLGKLQPGPFPESSVTYLVRGEADKTQVYSLSRYDHDARSIEVDDIVAQSPEIVRVSEVPAKDAIPLAALWPLERDREIGTPTPEAIKTFERLPASVNACVEFVDATAIPTMPIKVLRSHPADFRDMPNALRPDYCRGALASHVWFPPMAHLAPADTAAPAIE